MCFFLFQLRLFCSCVVCFCCVMFCFFSAKRLAGKNVSEMTFFLCRMERKTLINQSLFRVFADGGLTVKQGNRNYHDFDLGSLPS